MFCLLVTFYLSDSNLCFMGSLLFKCSFLTAQWLPGGGVGSSKDKVKPPLSELLKSPPASRPSRGWWCWGAGQSLSAWAAPCSGRGLGPQWCLGMPPSAQTCTGSAHPVAGSWCPALGCISEETTERLWKPSKGSVPGTPSTPRAQPFQQLSLTASALSFPVWALRDSL